MTLEEAANWVDRNCNDETVARLRSRAVAKVLFNEVRRQEELIHDLAGVLWRLEEYGYIGREIDDDERGQCDHWREIGRQAVAQARRPKREASNVELTGLAPETTDVGARDELFYETLTGLACIDCHETNLRDNPAAYAALDRLATALVGDD